MSLHYLYTMLLHYTACSRHTGNLMMAISLWKYLESSSLFFVFEKSLAFREMVSEDAYGIFMEKAVLSPADGED